MIPWSAWQTSCTYVACILITIFCPLVISAPIYRSSVSRVSWASYLFRTCWVILDHFGTSSCVHYFQIAQIRKRCFRNVKFISSQYSALKSHTRLSVYGHLKIIFSKDLFPPGLLNNLTLLPGVISAYKKVLNKFQTDFVLFSYSSCKHGRFRTKQLAWWCVE